MYQHHIRIPKGMYFLTHNIPCNWYSDLETEMFLIYGEALGTPRREMACLNCVTDQNILSSPVHVGALASDFRLMRQGRQGQRCDSWMTGFRSQRCPWLRGRGHLLEAKPRASGVSKRAETSVSMQRNQECVGHELGKLA